MKCDSIPNAYSRPIYSIWYYNDMQFNPTLNVSGVRTAFIHIGGDIVCRTTDEDNHYTFLHTIRFERLFLYTVLILTLHIMNATIL